MHDSLVQTHVALVPVNRVQQIRLVLQCAMQSNCSSLPSDASRRLPETIRAHCHFQTPKRRKCYQCKKKVDLLLYTIQRRSAVACATSAEPYRLRPCGPVCARSFMPLQAPCLPAKPPRQTALRSASASTPTRSDQAVCALLTSPQRPNQSHCRGSNSSTKVPKRCHPPDLACLCAILSAPNVEGKRALSNLARATHFFKRKNRQL